MCTHTYGYTHTHAASHIHTIMNANTHTHIHARILAYQHTQAGGHTYIAMHGHAGNGACVQTKHHACMAHKCWLTHRHVYGHPPGRLMHAYIPAYDQGQAHTQSYTPSRT